MSFFSARLRWFIWRIVPVIGLVIGLVAFGLLAWYLLFADKSTDQDVSVSSNSVSKSPSPEAARSDSSDLLSEKEIIKATVTNCIEQYYYRDSSLLAGDSQQATDRLRQNLEPYVTDGFLDSYISPLLSAQADYDFRDASGVQKVKRVIFTGDGEPDIGVEAEVTIVVTVPGFKPSTYPVNVVLTLEKVDETYLVSSLLEE